MQTPSRDITGFDVGADRDEAAVLGAALVDLQPAPILKLQLETAGAGLRDAVGDYLRADERLAAGGDHRVVQASRALALIRGREYALAEDVQALAHDAFRHRLVLTYQALAEEVNPDTILEQVIAKVPVPQIDLSRSTAA